MRTNRGRRADAWNGEDKAPYVPRQQMDKATGWERLRQAREVRSRQMEEPGNPFPGSSGHPQLMRSVTQRALGICRR